MRINWVDAARGVAILLVLLYHSAQWAAAAGFESVTWIWAMDLLATLRLPLFFTLSGMLAVKWMTRPWRELLTSKVATLLWLYLLWQTISVVIYMVVPNVSTPGKTNLAEIITAAATPLRPQGALWFIWALAIFFIASRALWAIVPSWLIVTVAAFGSTFCFAGTISLGNVGWDGAAENYVFFAAGSAYAAGVRAAGTRMSYPIAGVFIVAWALFVLLVPFWDYPFVNLISRALGLAAGIGAGVLLSRLAVLRRAGSNTLRLYLPHYIALTILAFFASVLPLPSSAAGWLPAVLFVACLAICMAIWAASRHAQFLRSAFELPGWLHRIVAPPVPGGKRLS